jgi:hypothetical protein
VLTDSDNRRYCTDLEQQWQNGILEKTARHLPTFIANGGGGLENAGSHEYRFHPIAVFDGENRSPPAVLRPARPPRGKAVRPFLRRLLRAPRANCPKTEILLRGDSHYCSPQVLE